MLQWPVWIMLDGMGTPQACQIKALGPTRVIAVLPEVMLKLHQVPPRVAGPSICEIQHCDDAEIFVDNKVPAVHDVLLVDQACPGGRHNT